MFERYTDRARRVIVLSNEVAAKYGAINISTAHLLHALAAEGEGVAAQALQAVGINKAAIELRLVDVGKIVPANRPFTPCAKKCLEYALREALRLGHNYVGTEHLLLGILRESYVAGVEMSLGVEILRTMTTDAAVIDAVMNLLSGPSPQPAPAETETVAEPPSLAQKVANAINEEVDRQLSRAHHESATDAARTYFHVEGFLMAPAIVDRVANEE